MPNRGKPASLDIHEEAGAAARGREKLQKEAGKRGQIIRTLIFD